MRKKQEATRDTAEKVGTRAARVPYSVPYSWLEEFGTTLSTRIDQNLTYLIYVVSSDSGRNTCCNNGCETTLRELDLRVIRDSLASMNPVQSIAPPPSHLHVFKSVPLPDIHACNPECQQHT